MATRNLHSTALPRLLTRPEVAAHLGMSEKTLRNWSSANRGPRFVKVGGAVRYLDTDLREWLDARRAEALTRGGAA